MDESQQQAIDRDDDADSNVAAPEAPSIPDIMRAELESVLTSPDFLRAPTMNRLLVYLVTETAEGRADQLKAYSVAVDGLGRAPDYDARADSYPRVQVGRLRRMLDTYYMNAPTVAGYRLTIPSGRYRVSLASDALPVPDVVEEIAPPPPPLRITRAMAAQLAALLVAIIGVAALIAQFAPVHVASHDDGLVRPLVEFAEVPHGADRSARSDLVEATLINGLGRSEMFDLRIARRTADPRAHVAPARYRLSTDLLEGSRPRLFLRLWEQGPDRLLWSGDVALPPANAPGQSLEDTLAPVIATISRVNGLIATYEYQRAVSGPPTGYRCALLFYRYRKEQLMSEREPVRDCVERSIVARPGDAQMQALAAQLAVDRSTSSLTPVAERADYFASGLRHAQQAVSIDPLNAWAINTRAQIAVLRHSCPQAVRNALRASELQPYDPALLASTGVTMINCGDPRAEAMIRHAIALDDGADGQFYRPLLLLAISRDDKALAREALAAMSPPVMGRHVAFYMMTATGYAMIGDVPQAKAAWRQLKAKSPPVAGDPAGYFERIGYGEPVKDKAMQHLRAAGLVA